MTTTPTLMLGEARTLREPAARGRMRLPAHHLVTHAVVTGTTGSGKTGLLTVMVEESLRAGVPVLVLDVKGDLGNLLLGLPSFDAGALRPWVHAMDVTGQPGTLDEQAATLAAVRERGLREARIGREALQQYAACARFHLVTPGGGAGEPLHLLSSLERRSPLWDSDVESARAGLAAAVALVLRLVGREPDPARSREHVLLTVLAERRLRAGGRAELGLLLQDLLDPPFVQLGAMALDDYLPRNARKELAAALNSLLVAPRLEAWRTGQSLDVGAWLTPTLADPRTPCVVLSVAHLDDAERGLVLGVVLDAVLTWMRTLPGSGRLRAALVFDEIYGFLPPHPHDPPTKRPLVALLKQGRAFGLGTVVATQNPMDLDYRALGNAGLWCVGRLQTDADRARIVDGLVAAGGPAELSRKHLDARIRGLGNRWFLVRNAHADSPLHLLRPRHAISLLRGPMTRTELARAWALHKVQDASVTATDAGGAGWRGAVAAR